VRKAEEDLQVAVSIAQGGLVAHDHVCNLCQQCAEKYLKALLEELNLPIPRIHDLERLWHQLVIHHPPLRPLRRGLDFLSGFASEGRYPGMDATKRQAHSALRWASRVRETARSLLGIRPRKR
jgi:HEPN domain-containing protein